MKALLDRLIILTLIVAALAFYAPARTDGVNVSACTAPATWTPIDSSGAALSFTGVVASYQRCGNMVFAYGVVTYPATADVSAAIIGGLPVTVPNSTAAKQCTVTDSFEATLRYLSPNVTTTTMTLLTSASSNITNVTMSTDLVRFMCIYPSS